MLIFSFANIVNSIKNNIKLVKEPYFAFLYEMQHFREVLFGLFFQSSASCLKVIVIFLNDTLFHCSTSSNYKCPKTSVVKFTKCVLGYCFLII